MQIDQGFKARWMIRDVGKFDTPPTPNPQPLVIINSQARKIIAYFLNPVRDELYIILPFGKYLYQIVIS